MLAGDLHNSSASNLDRMAYNLVGAQSHASQQGTGNTVLGNDRKVRGKIRFVPHRPIDPPDTTEQLEIGFSIIWLMEKYLLQLCTGMDQNRSGPISKCSGRRRYQHDPSFTILRSNTPRRCQSFCRCDAAYSRHRWQGTHGSDDTNRKRSGHPLYFT
jgi:hypothetical protein